MSEEIATAAGNLAEIARLRSALSGTRDVLAQRDRALVAERRAREMVEADNAMLVRAAQALARTAARQVTGYDDQVVLILRMALNDLNRIVDQPHPGTPLLAVLDAAREAVLEQTTKAYADLMNAVAAYDAAVKVGEE